MSRPTTDSVKSFSVYFLRENGKLEPGSRLYNNQIIWSTNGEEIGRISYFITTYEDPHMQLDYKTKTWGEEEWRPIKYKIPLEPVACNFGGFRWYFRCPIYTNNIYCGRRVAVMYKNSDYFTCRHCANLTYDICNESQRHRTWFFKAFSDETRAEQLYEKIKRTHYNGKPTRRYRRYLQLMGYSEYLDN